ncbi:tumor necrosis factor a (TNF superfamily, member 2) [Diretmus argenteus]
MEGECTVVMEASESRRQSSRHGWKLVGSLLAVTLCAAAALCFAWNAKVREHTENADDLRHTLRQISGNVRDVRDAIHLQGKYNTTLNTLEWKMDVDQSHCHGFQLDSNEIVIPRSGLYFVYSQVSFEVNCHSDADAADAKSMVHLSHTVKRWSASYGDDDAKKVYRSILHTVRTACQKTTGGDDDKGSWFSTVNMGAVFTLMKGDRLKAPIEEKLLAVLDDKPGNTFFGAFAL